MSAFSISSSDGLIPLIIHEISKTKSKIFVIPSCVMSPIVSTEQSKLVKNLDAVEGWVIKELQLEKSFKIYFYATIGIYRWLISKYF